MSTPSGPRPASTAPRCSTVFLTLGWATGFLWEVCTIDGFGTVLNDGLNKVRFPAGLKVNSRIRMHVILVGVRDLDGKGAEAIWGLTYEAEGETKRCGRCSWSRPPCSTC